MKYPFVVLAVILISSVAHSQQRAASVNYARAVAEAGVLIEQGKKAGRYPPVPEPPSDEPTCEQTKEQEERRKKFEEAREKYYTGLFQEELRVIPSVIEADKALQAAGGKPDPDWNSVVNDVLRRVAVPKVNSLLRQYGGRRAKFSAVAYVAIKIGKQVASVGGDGHIFLDEVGRMAVKNSEEGLKKIREEHDYTQVQPVIESHREATLLGALDSESLQKLIEELTRALTFKLKLEGTYETQAGDGGGKVTTEAEINVKPDEKLKAWEGHHSGQYTSGELKTDEGTVNVVLKSFPIVAKLENFDPCKDMVVDVIFDHIGADQDQLIYQGRAIPSPRPISVVETPGKALFVIGGNYQPSTGFKFARLPLRNKQQIAVDKTVNHSQNQEGAKASAQIRIQLIHSPKK